jgi:putative intracellular protease/amidase
MPKILFVVTSHSEIDSEHKTGLWLDEYATPYAALRNAGFEIVTASPRGGAAPIDPRSLEGADAGDAATAALAQTHPLHEVGDALQYDAIFIPGGHGTMFDLSTSLPLKTLLSEFDAQGKLVASVCHGPAAFVDAIRAGEPKTLVSGKTITCFTDDEERATGLAPLMPFLLASKLREQGANVVEGAPWQDHVEVDGTWITGQNPQSSASVAEAVISALRTHA